MRKPIRPVVREQGPPRVIPLLLLGGVLLAGADSLADERTPAPIDPRAIVVTSLEDALAPPEGEMTLRAAIQLLAPGGTITFDPALDGQTIDLVLIGEPHAQLVGEYYPMGRFEGYVARDYGASALYAAKDLTIDASDLPHGITIRWDGGQANHARILAVLGDLTIRDVLLTGGHAKAEPTGDAVQPYTLGRGGALAVWGTVTLDHCTVAGNRADGDTSPSRDRGAFGGGIYAERVLVGRSVISGNRVSGYGAAGGGIYSVGGVDDPREGSEVERSAITGNRVTGEHAYGGGIYSDGGGPGNNKTLKLTSTTIARNVVEDHPEIGEPPGAQYYFRGGGVYMSNGSLDIASCTIAENEVTGIPAIFRGRPNMGGGGIAATIGDAHVVERMELQHSIIAGNEVNGEPSDVYTGSLVHFYSWGFNRIGVLDFSQMLVPVPPWWSLSRRHWPEKGDEDGVALAEVLALDEVERHPEIVSAGADAGAPAVLSYPPTGRALDQVPGGNYRVRSTLAQYRVGPGRTDDFPEQVLIRLRKRYGSVLGSDFGSDIEPVRDIPFVATPRTWPGEPGNVPWIGFWRDLEAAIGDRLDAGALGDGFWKGFKLSKKKTAVRLSVRNPRHTTRLTAFDQQGTRRPLDKRGDIGAIER